MLFVVVVVVVDVVVAFSIFITHDDILPSSSPSSLSSFGPPSPNRGQPQLPGSACSLKRIQMACYSGAVFMSS